MRVKWSPFEGSSHRWDVVAPPARTLTLRTVELPDDLQAYRPNAAPFDFARATLVDEIGVEGLAGYLLRRAPHEGERQRSDAELWRAKGARRRTAVRLRTLGLSRGFEDTP